MLQIPTRLKSEPEALNSPGFRGIFLQQLGGGHSNRRLGVQIVSAQPASAVSGSHVPTEKNVSYLP